VLTLAAGAAQTVASGGRSAPLTVQVTQGGLPVRGAQVHFAVSSGAGSLRAQNAAAALGAQLSLTTDANGTASVVYLADASTGSTGVTATLGSGVGGSSVDFSLTIAETATTYTYAPSNSAPFDGLVGALGGSNAPSSNPFVDPVLQADSKSMYASWEKWTDYPGQQYFKSYGLIDHMWDDKMIKVPDDGSADTSTDLTPLVIKRFQDEPWLFHADPRDATGFPWAPPALYQHYYNQTTDGPWYEPTSESEWQRRNVTALKVVTYVPQKEPAEMTFLALVYQGDGWPPASDQPRGTPVTSGVIRVKGSASTWSKTLNAYCSLKDGAVIVDPGPEGERLIGKAESKYLQVVFLQAKFALSDNQYVSQGWDSTISTTEAGVEPWVSVGVGLDNEIVEIILPDGLNNSQHPDNDFELVVAPGSEPYISINWGAAEGVIPAYGGHTPFRIHGLKENKSKKADVILRRTGREEALLILHVVVLPVREIKADIMYISPSGKEMPSGTPSATQIIEMLNKTFSLQASVQYSLGKVATHDGIIGGGIFSAAGNLDNNGTIDSAAQAIITLCTGTLPGQDSFNSRTRIYIVPHIRDTRPGKNTVGFTSTVTADSFWSADSSPLALIHEVGHGLQLSTQGFDGLHDNGPWPPEIPKGKTGLMHPNVDNATKWIRKKDWIQANESASSTR